jgi:hypothetical protein
MCVGPIIFSILDEALTLLGQPADYWSGNYEHVLEWNPLANWALRQHPAYFVTGSVVWAALYCTAIICLPANPARVLAFSVQFGHTLGASSWLARVGPLGWIAAVALILISRLVLDFTWKRAKMIDA